MRGPISYGCTPARQHAPSGSGCESKGGMVLPRATEGTEQPNPRLTDRLLPDSNRPERCEDVPIERRWRRASGLTVGERRKRGRSASVEAVTPFVSGPRMVDMAFEASQEEIREKVELDAAYLTLMLSSGVLAAVALLTNSVPLLVGSMVVAPVLAPLELVSIATIRRRWRLFSFGAVVAIVGIAVATVGAIGVTVLFNVTGVLPAEANLIEKPLLEERVRPGWYSVVAALAAGVAGSLATVQDRTDTLVGVVAALAIVPAAAAGGISLLSRSPSMATGGLYLLAINVALIVLTGIATLSLFHRYQS